MSKLRIVAGDGSMQKKVMTLMERAGMPVEIESSRRKEGKAIGVDWIKSFDFQRPHDIPRRLEEGHFDLAIVGEDWLANWGVEFPTLLKFRMGRNYYHPVRIVLAVPNDARINSVNELPRNCTIATEYTRLAEKFLTDELKRKDIRVEYSPGNTEDKPRFGADAIIDVTESGESLRANDLRVIWVLMKSCTVIVANEVSLKDSQKKLYIDHFVRLLEGATRRQSTC